MILTLWYCTLNNDIIFALFFVLIEVELAWKTHFGLPGPALIRLKLVFVEFRVELCISVVVIFKLIIYEFFIFFILKFVLTLKLLVFVVDSLERFGLKFFLYL